MASGKYLDRIKPTGLLILQSDTWSGKRHLEEALKNFQRSTVVVHRRQVATGSLMAAGSSAARNGDGPPVQREAIHPTRTAERSHPLSTTILITGGVSPPQSHPGLHVLSQQAAAWLAGDALPFGAMTLVVLLIFLVVVPAVWSHHTERREAAFRVLDRILRFLRQR